MKTKFIIGAFLALSLSQYSCNKILDLDPLDKVADGNYWKTPNDFKLFANQFYGWRRDFISSVYDSPHSDHRSDLIAGTDVNVYSQGTNTIPNTDGNYTGAYNRIRLTNTLLEKAKTYSKPSDIAVSVAEAKFFRAYVYFELLQLYGGVVIVDRMLDVTSPELTAARNSREEVADFIIKDLQESIPDLPLQSAITNADAGRISQGTAQAFLSRVALYEGTWEKFLSGSTNIAVTPRVSGLLDIAAKAAKDVITSNQYSLFAPEILGDSAQKYMFILEDQKSNPAGLKKTDNKEYIFVNRHEEVLSPIGQNITHHTFANAQFVTRKFANMYLSNNGLPIDNPNNTAFLGYVQLTSEFTNRDNRMRYTLMPAGKNYFRESGGRTTWTGDAAEYANAPVKNFNPRSNSGYHNQKWATERPVASKSEGYDYPIIRYAEVLMNYAEAVYEKDNAISDADLDLSLNLVRRRVNKMMPKLSNAFANTNGLNIQTEIRRERTVEFFNEGFRIDDLKRWRTAEVEMPKDLLGVKWEGTAFQTGWASPGRNRNADGVLIMNSGRTWTEKNYLYPLPTDQLGLNPNLKPNNPGWN